MPPLPSPRPARPRWAELGGGEKPHASIAIAFGGQNSATTLRQGPSNNVPRLAGDAPFADRLTLRNDRPAGRIAPGEPLRWRSAP
jgi:hypothetical protein